MATTEVAKVDKGKQKLSKAIAGEIKFEEENYQADDTAKSFLDKNGFSLRDEAADNNVELTKKVGSVTVQVAFQSRPPQFNEEEGQDEEGQDNIQKNQQGEEEENYGEQNFADFTVYIIQTNGKALAFECTSFDSEININFVSVTNDVQGHKEGPKLERNTYSADFSILDERLQTAFLEYLKGFGINEDVALFVEHYSQDKDQRQYVNWLKDINGFIDRPLE